MNGVISNLINLHECYMCPMRDAEQKEDSPWSNKELTQIRKSNEETETKLYKIRAKVQGERLRIELKRATKELKHLQSINEGQKSIARRLRSEDKKTANKGGDPFGAPTKKSQNLLKKLRNKQKDAAIRATKSLKKAKDNNTSSQYGEKNANLKKAKSLGANIIGRKAGVPRRKSKLPKHISEGSAGEAKLKRVEKSLVKKRRKLTPMYKGGPDDRIDANNKTDKINNKIDKVLIKRASKQKAKLKRIAYKK